MHVAFVFHSYSALTDPEQLIRADATTQGWSVALRKQGIRLTVIHRFGVEAEIEFEGVTYLFLKDNIARMPKPWHSTFRFNRRLAKIMKNREVDLVHGHNLFSSGVHLTMSYCLKHYPILIQDHLGVPAIRKRTWWLRKGLSRVQAVIFSAQGQDTDWISKGVLELKKVHYVMENTSPFKMQPRYEARKITCVEGDPVFLWVGNLNQNKSPFTALNAFRKILEVHSKARFYMVYKENDMEGEIRVFLEQHPELYKGVNLIGQLDSSSLEKYYNSADYFVAASHKEGSGYAAIEAISCGVVPILSDIPSFKSLTGNGEIGALFEVDNSDMLTSAALELMKKPLEEERNKTVEFYETHFSQAALGKNMLRIYESIISDFEGQKRA